jgi:hypothetical protein
MSIITRVFLVALSVVLWVGCGQPAAPVPPPDEPAAAAPHGLKISAAAISKPEPAPATAVAMAEIERAAELYKVLNDAAMPDEQKQATANARLEANGWTEEAYQALLYDIAQDPASRAAYVERTQPK